MKKILCIAIVIAGMILAFGSTTSFAQDREQIKEIRKKKRRIQYDEEDTSGLVRTDGMNVIDRARFSIAEIEMKREHYKEAVAELQRVANESPDNNAVSAAHFSIGNIYRTYLNDPASATEHYGKVEGALANAARRAIIKLYEESGEVDKAIAELEKLIEEATDKRDKVDLLVQIADIYSESGNDDKAIATLRRIEDIVTYEEAAQMQRTTGDNDKIARLRAEVEELKNIGKFDKAKKLEEKLKRFELKKERKILKNKKDK